MFKWLSFFKTSISENKSSSNFADFRELSYMTLIATISSIVNIYFYL